MGKQEGPFQGLGGWELRSYRLHVLRVWHLQAKGVSVFGSFLFRDLRLRDIVLWGFRLTGAEEILGLLVTHPQKLRTVG